MRLAAIDVETTGLARYDRIVSFGAVVNNPDASLG